MEFKISSIYYFYPVTLLKTASLIAIRCQALKRDLEEDLWTLSTGFQFRALWFLTLCRPLLKTSALHEITSLPIWVLTLKCCFDTESSTPQHHIS